MSDSLAQALRWATAELGAAGVASAEADAVLIAAHLLNLDRGEVQAKAIIGAPVPEGFEELVRRRSRREPLQHLTGTAPFRRIELAVGPGVFIPRPETELLVDLAAERLRRDQAEGTPRPLAIDLCTGSGAIAAALADEVPHARLFAVELSEEAHAWAQRNLAGHRVDLRLGDATRVPDDLRGRMDVVVSNPPYVPGDEVPTEPEVIDHDPRMALMGGGADGMQIPERIIAAAASLLKAGGWCAIEHAESQAAAVAEAFARHGFSEVEGHDDLTDRPRATSAVLSGRSAQDVPGHPDDPTQREVRQ
ncbi:peptide chain release factor N(5)-glutamine methyltransferase [Kocuria coralli]|uniref:Release factor glutamine methyltransferase n=1 Tax=Kocuria coralli TaxID=1461025 RepID=A0A5J5L3I2_9MICC|nr:peptide chain release factor N(5)-glutamine methyltransferase [Kocuria coralli]KAA9395646.1 peptide chain release factor N(5)-glutamine methyltransferase [Kocuria coralli]